MDTSSKPGRPPLTRGEKFSDFAFGFFGELLLLILVAAVIWAMVVFSASLPQELVAQWLSLIVSAAASAFGLLNIAIAIWMAFRRPWIGLGIVTLWAIAFALVILAGAILAVVCFQGLSNI